MFSRLEQLLIIPLSREIRDRLDRHKLEVRKEMIKMAAPRLKVVGVVALIFISAILIIDINQINQWHLHREYRYYFWFDVFFPLIVILFFLTSCLFPKLDSPMKLRLREILYHGGLFAGLCWSAGISAVEYSISGNLLTYLVAIFMVTALFYPGSLFMLWALPGSFAFFILIRTVYSGQTVAVFSLHYDLVFLLIFAWTVSRLMHRSFYRGIYNRLLVKESREKLEQEAASHRKTAGLLREMNRDLEKMVTERTAELSIKNMELKKEIEERKITEELMRVAKFEAETASKIKSHFLAMMSHEIRTPLNGIIGILQLLEDESSSELLPEYYSLMKKSSLNLMSIIEDLLDLSQIEEGKMPMASETFDIRDIILSSVEHFEAVIADDSPVKIQWIVDDNFPPFIEGYPMRLLQVLNNLIDNGIKFTEKGTVTVTAFLSDEGGEEKVNISIRDTGIGIDKKKISMIFSSFSQVEDVTSRRFGGAGLGLAISKQLVELMGGLIKVDSIPGEGSTFTIVLPLTVSRKLNSEKEIEKEEKGKPSEKSLKILVAEDEEISQKVILRILEKEGHEVTLASNGREALELYRNNEYDCILMDAFMPEMDGLEAVEKIRELENISSRHTTVIALTADAISGSRERYLKRGMDEYISKPVKIKELRSILAKVVSHDE